MKLYFPNTLYNKTLLYIHDNKNNNNNNNNKYIINYLKYIYIYLNIIFYVVIPFVSFVLIPSLFHLC